MSLDSMKKTKELEIDGKSDAEVTAMLRQMKIDNGDTSDVKDEYVESELTLRDKYTEPPFSVLDTKTGSWQKRKKKWLELGIKSEVGRDVEVLPGKSNNDYMPDMTSSTSIFDPALCELMYTWFCPKGGTILDPFAGGSVRGIVAHLLGYKYIGIELRPEQVESNREQARAILPMNNQPTWICGDSEKVMEDWNWDKNYVNMVFSCPPYANLEVYSNLPDDLSNMPYKYFLEKYTKIIEKCASLLVDSDSFAVFVVGDVRDEKGYYLDFISDTKKAFTNPFTTSTKLWNDMVLLDPIGTAMIRANGTFKSKKVVKVHQNVLCFKKM